MAGMVPFSAFSWSWGSLEVIFSSVPHFSYESGCKKCQYTWHTGDFVADFTYIPESRMQFC